MNNKLKNIIISISFVTVLFIFMVGNIISNDKEISYEERRKLKQLPKFTVEKLLEGKYFSEVESYLLDQFTLRQEFRKIKTFVNTKILNQKDNNDIYTIDENIYKMEYPTQEKSINESAKLYNKIASTYFENSNIYYTIVPDKNYFVPKDKGYLSLDYTKLVDIMKQETKDMKYIDILSNLSIDDYYKTDLHWRQENLVDVADKILESMNNENKSSDYIYEEKIFDNFYGSYYGQLAGNIKPDELIYISNDIINDCRVYDYEKQKYIEIYNDEDFENIDSYDVYLGGARPLLEIQNPNNKSQKELYIFRDSFGSSLAPLLVSEYSKITLIDLRYINNIEFEKYIKPKENSDVLFMYNTLILNNNGIISRFFS